MSTNAEDNLYFHTHIFCCTNERDEDASRGSCARSGEGGHTIRSYMKKRLKQLKLPKARVNASGCLDRCEMGPVLVVYPQGIWYHCPTEEDAEEIIQSHFIGGKVVERLRLDAKQKRL